MSRLGRNYWSPNYLKCLGLRLGFAAIIAAPSLNGFQVLAEVLGVQSVVGEQCLAQPSVSTRIGAGDFLKTHDIQCDGEDAGSIYALARVPKDLTFANANEFFASQYVDYFPGLDRQSCAANSTINYAGKRLFALGCRDETDGWPLAYLGVYESGSIKIATGPAAAMPAFANTLSPTNRLPDFDWMTQIKSLWGDGVRLGSAAERLRVAELWQAARVSNARFRYREAENAVRAALNLQLRIYGEDDQNSNMLGLDLAMILANRKQFSEADALIRRLGPIIDRSPRVEDRARLASYNANIEGLRGDYVAALASAKAAVQLWRVVVAKRTSGELDDGTVDLGQSSGEGAKAELALALNQVAVMHLKLGDPLSANILATEALLTIQEASVAPLYWRAEILTALGSSAMGLGRLSAAEAFFKKALETREKALGRGAGALRIQVALGAAYEREGMHVNAIIAFREAIEIAKGLADDSSPFTAEDIAPFADAAIGHAESLSTEEERIGLFSELYEAFQLVRTPNRNAALQLASARVVSSDKDLTNALKRLTDLRRNVSLLRGRLSEEQSKPSGQQDAGKATALLAEIRFREAEVASGQKFIAEKFPQYEALNSAKPPALEEIRSRIKDNEAVISFIVGKSKSYAQMIERNSIKVVSVDAGETELRQMVDRLRKGLEIEGKSVSDFDLAEAHHLYGLLFSKLENQIADKSRLIIKTQGPLSELPFAVLVRKPITKRNAYSDAHWLIKSHEIMYTPSLPTFLALRKTRFNDNQAKAFLGVADPVLNLSKADKAPQIVAQGCGRAAVIDPNALKALGRLPETLTEVRSVAKSLNLDQPDVLFGSAATEEFLRKLDLESYRVLYFATHAIVPGELRCETEPGLVLTPPDEAAQSRDADGLLSASEISALNLRADLVVLSACNTASGAGGSAGDSLSGLAESFFFAGARSLMASHWQIPSQATTVLMGSVFAKLGQGRGLSIDQSLRAAQMEVIANRATSHPFFWGAFAVVGDGSSNPIEKRLKN